MAPILKLVDGWLDQVIDNGSADPLEALVTVVANESTLGASNEMFRWTVSRLEKVGWTVDLAIIPVLEKGEQMIVRHPPAGTAVVIDVTKPSERTRVFLGPRWEEHLGTGASSRYVIEKFLGKGPGSLLRTLVDSAQAASVVTGVSTRAPSRGVVKIDVARLSTFSEVPGRLPEALAALERVVSEIDRFLGRDDLRSEDGLILESDRSALTAFQRSPAPSPAAIEAVVQNAFGVMAGVLAAEVVVSVREELGADGVPFDAAVSIAEKAGSVVRQVAELDPDDPDGGLSELLSTAAAAGAELEAAVAAGPEKDPFKSRLRDAVEDGAIEGTKDLVKGLVVAVPGALGTVGTGLGVWLAYGPLAGTSAGATVLLFLAIVKRKSK